MKRIFITGTSSGLGKAAVELFHNMGWQIIATMRNMEQSKQFSHLENVTVLPLDITNVEQIESTVAAVTELYAIDVVVNNAAYGFLGALEGVTDEQLIKQINNNLLGTIRVTKAFLPHFRTKKNGIFINITSSSGLLTIPFASLYHAVKFGLEGWSEGMSYELQPFGVQVKTVAPGGIKSGFQANMDTSPAAPYKEIFDKYLDMIISPEATANYSSPEAIAEVIYEAATDEKDQVHYLAGEDAKAMYQRRLEIGAEASRQEIAKLFLG